MAKDKPNQVFFPDFLSASTIKKDKIVDPAGEDLGKIESLMTDLEYGRIAYAVVSFGGFLGMGNKLFAIPCRAFSFRMYEHAFSLDIPRDVLRGAEGFDKDNLPANHEQLSIVYNYFGYQPYWEIEEPIRAGTSAEILGEKETERMIGKSTPIAENPEFLSADEIKGNKVVNRVGDDLGKIEELMIDLHNGKIAYVVLSFGGFLGLGNKLFAIPWEALTLRLYEHAFLLDIPRDVLEKAEGFDKDHWPDTNREWLANMYRFYGYQPYWRTGMVENRPGNL